MSPAALSEAAGLAREVETLGRELSRWLGDGGLPPEADEALRSLSAVSGRLSALQAEMVATIDTQAGQTADLAATIATQERQIAELIAQITALTAQISVLRLSQCKSPQGKTSPSRARAQRPGASR